MTLALAAAAFIVASPDAIAQTNDGCDDPSPGQATTQTGPDRIVQSDGYGDICRLELRVMQEMAARRGVEFDARERDRLLYDARDQVRGAIFGKLLELIASDEPRDEVEQGAVDWLAQRVRSVKIDMAQDALDEYDRWETLKCGYVPPSPFSYNPGTACTTNTGSVFSGSPRPPTVDDFTAYGIGLRLSELFDNPFIEQTLSATADGAREYWFGLAAGGSVGVALAATAGVLYTIGTLAEMFQVIFPFANATFTSVGLFGGGALAGFTGGFIAIVVAGVVLSVIRAIQLADDAAIPDKLQNALDSAHGTPDLHAMAENQQGQETLLAAFTEATLPDFTCPEEGCGALPPVPTAPGPDSPLFVSGPRQDAAVGQTFRIVEPSGQLADVWIDDGWWVIDPVEPPDPDCNFLCPQLPNRLALSLEYKTQPPLPDDVPLATIFPVFSVDRATLAGGGFIRTTVPTSEPDTGTPLSCDGGPCHVTIKLADVASTPVGGGRDVLLAGRRPVITQAPEVVSGELHDDATVVLHAAAEDPEGSSIHYEWYVSRPAIWDPSFTVTDRYVGPTVQHHFVGGGPYDITVVAYDVPGASATSTIHVDVAGSPPAIYGVKTYSFRYDEPDGTVRERPLFEGGPDAGYQFVRFFVSGNDAIDVDWTNDGIWDVVNAPVGDQEYIDLPPAPYPQNGTYFAKVAVHNLAGDEVTELVPIDVANLPPTWVDVQVNVDGTWQWLSNEIPAEIKTFAEGDTIQARFRVDDPGPDDALTAELLWSDGKVDTMDVGVRSNMYEFPSDVPASDWNYVEHTYGDDNSDTVGLEVTVFDEMGDRSPASDWRDVADNLPAATAERGKAYYHVADVAVEATGAVTVDAYGVATLRGTVVDPGTKDPTALVIDWGDGTEPETVDLPQALPVTGDENRVEVAPDRFQWQHSYTALGSYPVSVDVQASGSSAHLDLTAGVANLPPAIDAISEVGSFDYPAVEAAPTGFLVDTSDPDGATDAVTLMVDWGDGTDAVEIDGFGGSRLAAAHVYTQDGIYTAGLTLTDAAGAATSMTLAIDVVNRDPSDLAISPSPASGTQEGDLVTIDASVVDVPDDVLHATLDWGDGTMVNIGPENITGAPELENQGIVYLNRWSLTESHSYADQGTYTVSVQFFDDGGGGSGLESVDLSVANADPVIAGFAVAPASGAVEGSTVMASGVVSDAGSQDELSVEIDWGDGSAADALTPADDGSFAADHVYADNGDYQVRAIGRDTDGGASQPSTVTFAVANADPVVTDAALTDRFGGPIDADLGVISGDEVTVTATVTDAGVLDTHTWSVEWGDAATSAGPLPATHAYDTTGTFDIDVQATDNDGGTGSATVSIRVRTARDAVEIIATRLRSNAGGDRNIAAAADQLDGPRPGDAAGALADGDLAEAAVRVAKAIDRLDKAATDQSDQIRVLLLVQRNLAVQAIAAAEAAGADPDLIATAQMRLAAGDAAFEAGDQRGAAKAYRKAVTVFA